MRALERATSPQPQLTPANGYRACLSSCTSIPCRRSARRCWSLSMRTTRRSSRTSSISAMPSRAAELEALWPIGKFPVLRDEAQGSHGAGVEHHHRVPGSALSGRDAVPARRSGPRPPDAHASIASSIYTCSCRCRRSSATGCGRPGKSDPFGVEQARAQLQTALGMVDRDMATKTWAMGDTFSMADCAAAPALYYANLVAPFGDTHRQRGGLSGPPDAPSVVCARGEGGRALSQVLPAIAHAARHEGNNAEDPREPSLPSSPWASPAFWPSRRPSPTSFRVQRAASINAPPEKIFPLLNDLRAFALWSPYEKKDPAMQRTYSGAPSGKGAVYEWDGDKNVGKRPSGDCELLAAVQGHAAPGHAAAAAGPQHRRVHAGARRASRRTSRGP